MGLVTFWIFSYCMNHVKFTFPIAENLFALFSHRVCRAHVPTRAGAPCMRTDTQTRAGTGTDLTPPSSADTCVTVSVSVSVSSLSLSHLCLCDKILPNARALGRSSPAEARSPAPPARLLHPPRSRHHCHGPSRSLPGAQGVNRDRGGAVPPLAGGGSAGSPAARPGTASSSLPFPAADPAAPGESRVPPVAPAARGPLPGGWWGARRVSHPVTGPRAESGQGRGAAGAGVAPVERSFRRCRGVRGRLLCLRSRGSAPPAARGPAG